jgi:hypothetical protein
MRTLGKAIVLAAILTALCAPLTAQTNPVPFINNPLVPGVVAPGGLGFTLTVNGAGFVSGSIVKWNGSARTTTFVTPTQLHAAILASDIATARTVLVTVSNPAPGGGTSDAVFFGVTTPTSTIAVVRTDVGGSAIYQPSGMTEGDFDRNGIPDLAVANSQCPQSRGCVLEHADIVILNDGHSVGDVPFTAASPTSITNGDFNGDGFLDLITMNATAMSLILGNGNGTFQIHTDYPIPAAFYPASLATGDFNRDGHLDLVVVSSGSSTGSVSILLGNGDGTFGTPISYNTGTLLPSSVAVGDFNGDGKLDLAVSDLIANTISIFLGNGDGTFQSPVEYSTDPNPGDIVIADFNGDGKLDLAVASNNTIASIFLGKGDGTFQPKVDYPEGITITWLTIGDYNGDGIPDLAVSDSHCNTSPCPATGSVNVLLGNGDGTFQSHLDFATGSDPSSIATGEFNSPGQTVGRSGFATVNYQDNTVSIFTPIPTGPVNSVPTISSITPPSVQVGSGGFTITVNGANFVTGSAVLFGGSARTTTFVSPTQVIAAIFATDVANAGTFSVSVMNPAPGGGGSTSIPFSVFLPPPTISSLSPSSVVVGGPAFTLTVNGLNFVDGAFVNFNGVPSSATFVSSAQLTISVSASTIASQGTINISVTDPPAGGSPGGTTSSLPLAILPTNTQPVIGALVPASATAGGPAFTLTLTGTGFTSSSVVTFKSSVVSAAFVSATELQAAIPASAIAVAGTPFVTVANPGGIPSLVTTFIVNNPVPGASWLSPSSVPAGNAAATLNVTGTNFNTGSTVLVNGSSRATTYVSSTSLNAALLASDFAHSGTLNIAVNNPIPGGGTTSALKIVVEDFNVSVPAPSNSVVAGSAASYSLMVTPSNSTTANSVTFTVSGLPTGATPSFSPSAIIPAGSGATTVMLSITTMAHSAVPPTNSPRAPSPHWPSLYLATLVIVLMWLGLRVPSERVPRFAPQFLLVSLLVITSGLVACGGMPGSVTPSLNPATGTPAGTYSIVVTASSGNGSLSTTLTLKVT